MNKYIKTTLIFLGVWFVASFLNGLLSGASIAILSRSTSETMPYLFLSFVFSFVFSAPLVGLVWFIAIIAQANDKKGDSLFQFILGTAFFCAVAAALIFIVTIGTEFLQARWLAGLSIIVSAMTAVLFFRKQIKANA